MQTSSRLHTFLFDKRRGGYVDTGPATRFDKVVSRLTIGGVRVAPNDAPPQPTLAPAGYSSQDGFEPAKR